MNNKFLAACMMDFFDKIAEKFIAIQIINADTCFHGHRNIHDTLYFSNAFSH